MKKFAVFWRGSFDWYEVTEKEGFRKDEDIYAISWEPPKSDSRTRYIGIAIQQYIGTRLKDPNHDADNWLYKQHREKNIRYYLGKITTEKGRRKTEQNIKNIEAATIYYHYKFKDVCGANVLNSANYRGIDLEVRHLGNIPPMIENFRKEGEEWKKID